MSGLNPLKPAESIAERDARLATLTQLAGRMLHDFNNYLTPIKGYLALFKEDCPPESSTFRYAGLMEKAAGKIEINLEGVAAAVRPERNYRPAAIDFQDIVAESTAAWVARFSDSAPVLESRLTPCLLKLDAQQWRHVVFHLLENARLAGTGSVTVRLTREVLTPGRMAELGLKKTDTCLLEVTDNGCGMAPETLSKAFDPFFTTRSKDKAAGLGLTQAFSVTRLHGGQILLESQPEAGTKVSIWLPL
jgi:signal transduction histidine kinase